MNGYVRTRIAVVNGKVGTFPVTRVEAFPPGQHPARTPIVASMTAVRITTPAGVRWLGCARAYIDSNLRMAVEGACNVPGLITRKRSA